MRHRFINVTSDCQKDWHACALAAFKSLTLPDLPTPTTLRGAQNPFDAWIGIYESDEFQAAMPIELGWLSTRLPDTSPPPALSNLANEPNTTTTIRTKGRRP